MLSNVCQFGRKKFSGAKSQPKARQRLIPRLGRKFAKPIDARGFSDFSVLPLDINEPSQMNISSVSTSNIRDDR